MMQSVKMAELTALVAGEIFVDFLKANPDITTAEIVEQAFQIAVEATEVVKKNWVDPHTITFKNFGGGIVP